jgi:uncharacterized protein (DUF1919 family)
MSRTFIRISSTIKGQLHCHYVTLQKSLLKKRFHRSFSKANHCYISQNCIGGRFYILQGRRYTTPTVGLWFEPSGFLTLCENLKESLESEVLPDLEESNKLGYPVGRINGIKILFQHYSTFEQARASWMRRISRFSIENAFLLMTDRDGFTNEDMKRFAKLPTARKILFSHKVIPHVENVVYVPGFEEQGFVGDLYDSYNELNQRVVRKQLFSLLGRN